MHQGGPAGPAGGLAQRAHPALRRLEPDETVLDQGVANSEDQLVLAREVPVDGGRVGAERAAELGQAEAGHAVLVEQSQRLADEEFPGKAAAGEAAHMSPFKVLAALYGKRLVKAIDNVFVHEVHYTA